MLSYLARRLLYTLPIALGVSLVCFVLLQLAPGDQIQALLPDGATPEMIAQMRAAYGVDKPLPLQYLNWLARLLSGDFGQSMTTKRPVIDEVLPAVGHSLQLAGAAIVLSLILGCLLGAMAGARVGSVLDKLFSTVAVSGVSIPPYWVGMVLVILFAVELHWLPASGGGPEGFGWESLRYMALPVVALSIVPAGIIARSVRGAVSEAMRQEFVTTLRAKGLSQRRLVIHIAKNVAPGIAAVMGLQFAQLMGGSILVETVFSWPGAGFLLNNAIFSRDMPVLQGTILILAMFFVLMNVVVDICQMALDPRVKRD